LGLSKKTERASVFEKEFREDLKYWVKTDRKTALKVIELIGAIMKTPYDGIGKPEPLKYLGKNIWSRRITQEHRLVYLVRDERINFLQCRYHVLAIRKIKT
jgi:toxin YoeB